MNVKPRRRRSFRRNFNLPSADEMLDELGAEEIVRWGVRLLRDRAGRWKLKDVGNSEAFKTKNDALRSYFTSFGRRYGAGKQLYTLKHGIRWILFDRSDMEVARWVVRPTRLDLAHTIKRIRRRDSRPSFSRSDTLGWRTWDWNQSKRCLTSPSQGTLWPDPELRVENWSTDAAVRGKAGIHACRLPRGDWRRAGRPSDMPGGTIIGLLERFGRFVLGSEGWRAEWVIIKELVCADEALARQVKAAYPDIPVTVAHEGHWLRRV